MQSALAFHSRVAVVAACALLAGCAGKAGNDSAAGGPSLSAAILSAPFDARQGIICNMVELEISPEFFVDLTTPAKNPFHRNERLPGPPVEYRFLNESGSLTYPVSMAVRNLKLTVLESAVVRIIEGPPRRLSLTARGSVVLVGEDGTQRTFERLTIRDGAVDAAPR